MTNAEHKAEIEGLRAIISELHPPHRHDHDYYHSDCGLCQMEKAKQESLDDRIEKVLV